MILSIFQEFAWTAWRLHEISRVSIAGIVEKILNQSFPNEKQDCYPFNHSDVRSTNSVEKVDTLVNSIVKTEKSGYVIKLRKIYIKLSRYVL